MPTTIFDLNERKSVPMPDHVQAFLREVEALQRKYRLSISHEDGHGNFEILDYEDVYVQWLFDATLCLKKP